MRHNKIKIFGDFWDVFSYMNYLLLVTDSNELIIYNWKHINNFLQDYNTYEVSLNDLEKFIIKKITLPFKSSITDLCITNKKIYLTNDEGFYSSNSLENLQGITFHRLWDNRSFSLNYNGKGNIALSCGNDGLVEYSPYEYDLGLKKFESNIYSITETHSTSSNYNEFDLYNKSTIKESELIHFNLGSHFTKQKLSNFKFSDIVSSSDHIEIPQFNDFENNIVSWLHKNKVYKIISGRHIDVYSYKTIEHSELTFKKEERLHFQEWKGKILSGYSTRFGNIIECENALVVSTQNDFLNISGEIVSWKVYPNSKAYLNHLHLIKDEYIEIYEFF